MIFVCRHPTTWSRLRELDGDSGVFELTISGGFVSSLEGPMYLTSRSLIIINKKGLTMNHKQGLAPIHPGCFLKEILDELGISQAAFARTVGLSPMRISHVINGTRPVTAEMALLFGKAFSQTPQYWLNLQADYDLKIAGRAVAGKLTKISPVAHARVS